MNNIVKIYWNRVNLYLETESEIEGEAYLVSSAFKAPLSVNGNAVILNITNVPEGSMLESGEFFFELNGEKLVLDKSLIKNLDDYSRIFKYRNKFYALLIDFQIDENRVLSLSADYMMRNKKYKKNFQLSEGSGLKGKLKVFFEILFSFFLNVVYKFIRTIFLNKKRVLFYSENGDVPVGNLRFLYEYMKANSPVSVKCNCFNMHSRLNPVKILKAVYDIALSRVIVVDNYVSVVNLLNISKKQKVVQLWHAGVGFKSVGYARFGKDGGAHPFRSSHRKYDAIIVDSEKLVDVYKEVFGAKADAFKVYGMPRLDGYFTKEKIESVTKRLYEERAILEFKRVILFAPTFRGVGAGDAYYDYDKIDLKSIFDFCQRNDFCFIIKMHPFIKEKINIPKEYETLIFDYSSEDINDLIYIADVMVTDYSSCAYEFSFFNRPLVFYRYDKEIYEYERPLHTMDVFTEKQFEAVDFADLMKVLEELKDISVKERFTNIPERQSGICEKIAEEVLR